MVVYNKVGYYPCAYCEEIINTLLKVDKIVSQYRLTALLQTKMNKKTAIKHIDELIRNDILVDFSNPPELLFDEITDAFMETGKQNYGKPARKGILNFSNKGDLALLRKILEGSRKRQRRVLVLWFNYEWLMTNVKTSTS